ncbi:MAG: hypothetical protein CBC13_07860 [Planctomycetia bacterium TMED53]|nr:MAG: hypothetical protein CBC13_07860 [Planctomycetia bacterium TMED53]
MLANDDLGNHGRLGNQMFQYAALRGLAHRHGYEYCLPPRDVVATKDENVLNSDVTLFECFDIPEAPRLLTNFDKVEENSFGLDRSLWESCPDDISLFGFFQTEKYFKHIEIEIREAFGFVEEIKAESASQFEARFDKQEAISVHVRRGDYLNLSKHYPSQTKEYYVEGLTELPEDLPVLIFSDGIDWCKEQEHFQGDRFHFSEGNGTGVDLCLQSMCSYHIIANSSFSWWGSWLANSKKTIAPRAWFAGKKARRNMQDLYLPDWVVIGEKQSYTPPLLRPIENAFQKISGMFRKSDA